MRRRLTLSFVFSVSRTASSAVLTGCRLISWMTSPCLRQGGLDGMPIDFLDDVALLEAGLRGRRVGLDFGDHDAFDAVRHLKLLTGLQIGRAHAHTVECAVIGAVRGVVLGELFAAGHWLNRDLKGLARPVAEDLDRHSG